MIKSYIFYFGLIFISAILLYWFYKVYYLSAKVLQRYKFKDVDELNDRALDLIDKLFNPKKVYKTKQGVLTNGNKVYITELDFKDPDSSGATFAYIENNNNKYAHFFAQAAVNVKTVESKFFKTFIKNKNATNLKLEPLPDSTQPYLSKKHAFVIYQEEGEEITNLPNDEIFRELLKIKNTSIGFFDNVLFLTTSHRLNLPIMLKILGKF